MRADNLRKVVGDLESIADLIRWQVGTAAQARQSIYRDYGKAAVFSRLRDTLNSILGRNAKLGALRAKSRGEKMVHSYARHIDQARRKDVSPGGGGLIGCCTLIALLESATVGDASEWAGDKLRVIYVTEPAKNLVFLGDVIVDPNVKGIPMLIQSGVRCKI